MARPLRIEYPGAVYHVTSRGNEKKPVFKDEKDRLNFLNTLQHANKRYNWICHAYCLMTNHYHLLIETPDGNLAIGMRQLNGVYTQLFNNWHGRTGHLFQGRYKAILIQKDSHLLEVCRYVVLNPVRANMVETPEEYRWSSFRSNAEGLPDALVRRHAVYLALGRWGATRRAAYRALFETPLDAPVFDAIRCATNKGIVLGFDDGRAGLERALGRPLSRGEHGGNRRSRHGD